MKDNNNNEKKNSNSEELNKKFSNGNIYPHVNSKNSSKLLAIDEDDTNCFLYSDIKIDTTKFKNNINRTTIMPSLPSNDINQNILKFNRIRIKNITAKDLNLWKAILYNHNRVFNITQLNENKYINDDFKIFNNDEDNQINEFDAMDIISKDSIRTRCSETKLIRDFIKNLEALLRFFVKKNKIQYKQGLNEIAGAFLLLKYSNVKNNMTFSEVYNLLNGFFHFFTYNYYNDKTIYSIKNSLSLLQLLLKYHSPDLYNLFERAMLFPEVYGTSWILTAFSYKLKLDRLFYLWNKLILENDELMIHYFMAALLIYKKNYLINSDEYSLPLAINKLNINSEKEIDAIFNIAINLRNQTPYSFRMFAFKLDILKFKSSNHKVKYDFYHPDILLTIPIFSSEICYICYKKIIKCPDENHILVKTFNCEHCSMGLKKNINYVLIDLRNNESDNYKSGILQNVSLLEEKKLNNDKETINMLKERLSFYKDKGHIILIDSESKNLIDENSNFNTSKIRPKKANISKNEKNDDKTKKRKNSQNEKNDIKDDCLLKSLILNLIENNYKYVSYVYGGFEDIHNEILYNKKKAYSQIKLLNHIVEKCDLCKKNDKVSGNSKKSGDISTKKFSLFFKNSIKNKNKNEINKNEIIINNYKVISIDEVNKMIKDTDYFAGPCSFVINKKEKENDENQGLLIIYDKKLFCIKVPNQNNKQMEIINEIFLIKIKEPKIKSKIYCYIYFINDKQKEDNIIVKFNSEIDLEKFQDSFKKAKNEL